MKHPFEALYSWSLFLEREGISTERDGLPVNASNDNLISDGRRQLHRKHKNLYKSGIKKETVHGMMIDAGSQGTRIHVYEFDARTLDKTSEVKRALSGGLLSFPKSDSRWTNRLKPGLASFHTMPDDQLQEAIAKYLEPLIDFAKSVLKPKKEIFESFPIYLKATGGMRILDPSDRSRVMNAVRTLFYNKTYCPFWFEDERARVISGEEEAIFDWAGVNFLMGTLLEDSEGAGTVLNPRLTYGALDLGGASTQISFYEPNGDIMANLFKLQIGQGRHWNVYCHSFLFYGIDEATNRFVARLANGKSTQEKTLDGVHNPCMPGGTKKEASVDIRLSANGVETWQIPDSENDNYGYYTVVMKNDNDVGDFDACMEVTANLLHQEKNDWCDFSHKGDCSFAGIYQPDLPYQSEHFGEFMAFSNFNMVWEFLQLPSRANMVELRDKAQYLCNMSGGEAEAFNNGRLDDDQDVNDFCFFSVYVYQLLHNGYGFEDDEYVTSLHVIGGLKVGWALGSILYEINTLPWKIASSKKSKKHRHVLQVGESNFGGGVDIADSTVLATLVAAVLAFLAFWRRRVRRTMYEPIQSINV